MLRDVRRTDAMSGDDSARSGKRNDSFRPDRFSTGECKTGHPIDTATDRHYRSRLHKPVVVIDCIL